jgi:hypothetical protein
MRELNSSRVGSNLGALAIAEKSREETTRGKITSTASPTAA